MELKYTNDKSTQILISLLKAHGIKKVVASPGTTNAIFVASIQNDKDFEIYSSVDERSAAYIACGLSQKLGEPVAITCTEATASRNYYPGLTEAYYRKLPILAITGLHSEYNIGQLHTQAIDRSQTPKDTVKYSTTINRCNSKEDEWHVNFEINKALLELTKNGGGPVHINLQIGGRWDFYVDSLPNVRVIHRISCMDDKPELPKGKIAIVIGAHKRMTSKEIEAIDHFCASNNGVVFADIISGYYGKYRVNASILQAQSCYSSTVRLANLIIHIGEIGWTSAVAPQTWRVSEDGELRDTYHNLTYHFDMDLCSFFNLYNREETTQNTYYKECIGEVESIITKIPELPFSNAWIAQHTVSELPKGCIFHTGILNSFRVWNYYLYDPSIETSCNFGGFGIDGGLSTLIGSSIGCPEKIHFGVFGDLAFFYDMNVIGNRHVGNNVRILLINNGKGNEFRNCIHPAYKLREDADLFIAAAGHYGNKSNKLVRHYAEDLGYQYLSAVNKTEYLANMNEFLSPKPKDRPIIFEVFTDTKDESEALFILSHIVSDSSKSLFHTVKDTVRSVVGDKGIHTLKNLIK